METIKIIDDVYLFNSYLEFAGLNFSQFLLAGEKPVLIHTGTQDQAAAILPEIKEILGGRPLEYVFISHFESDECGGLSLLLNHYPALKPICSQVTARQLMGFGITKDILVRNPGDTLEAGAYKFKFISYPSEMHLWEGLMAFETEQGLLFSSDLFAEMGRLEEPVVPSSLKEEVQKIAPDRIPSPDACKAVKEAVLALPVKYILPGHGPCRKV